MPNGSKCPECEQKIILNGDIAGAVLSATCERVEAFVASGKQFPDALKLVGMANDLENMAFAFSREVMEQMGFKGPWPKSMA